MQSYYFYLCCFASIPVSWEELHNRKLVNLNPTVVSKDSEGIADALFDNDFVTSIYSVQILLHTRHNRKSVFLVHRSTLPTVIIKNTARYQWVNRGMS